MITIVILKKKKKTEYNYLNLNVRIRILKKLSFNVKNIEKSEVFKTVN